MSFASSKIVGILNVTPDSYFDGGKFTAVERAMEQAELLLNEGADYIDIGGESTGPGSDDVSEAEELERVLPVVKSIREHYPQAGISVDTYKSGVAQAAVEAGADMINDVTAGRGDPNMLPTIASAGVRYVLMYAKDSTARTTVADREYESVVSDIIQFLAERKQAAVQAGIASDMLVIDPGMGHFISSVPHYSFEVLQKLSCLQEALDCPVLVSPSRKSFLAGSENLRPKDRLPGTIVASAVAAQNGATYIRTHDVAAVRRGIETLQQLVASS